MSGKFIPTLRKGLSSRRDFTWGAVVATVLPQCYQLLLGFAKHFKVPMRHIRVIGADVASSALADNHTLLVGITTGCPTGRLPLLVSRVCSEFVRPFAHDGEAKDNRLAC